MKLEEAFAKRTYRIRHTEQMVAEFAISYIEQTKDNRADIIEDIADGEGAEGALAWAQEIDAVIKWCNRYVQAADQLEEDFETYTEDQLRR